MPRTASSRHVHVLGPPGEGHDEVLTPQALEFVGRLDAAFAGRRLALLAERRHRAELLASGGTLDFVPATSAVRADPGWHVPAPAPGLADRRVEITGPPARETAEAALTCGARVWVADFEDAASPSWDAVVAGQAVLRDATARAGSAKREATVVVRPRGWHRTERHLLAGGTPLAAALVDVGLYLFHCARDQVAAGRGPYFSLPKLENHLEARLWHDVFALAEDLLRLPRGTVRAGALIETPGAAFEMEEILHELGPYAAALETGRGNYLAALVRAFPHRADVVLPDRDRITMTAPFLRALTELLVHTCHKRGAHALGGPARHVPATDARADAAARARVRLEWEREAEAGFDGSRVAHPGLVPGCRSAFDAVLGARPHQIERRREDVAVGAGALLALQRSAGPPTHEGLRSAVAVAVRWFEAWLRGCGNPVIDGLLEDAAGAEEARTRVWQWLRHQAVPRETVLGLLDAECAALTRERPGGPVPQARALFVRTALSGDLPAFVTADACARRLVRRPAFPSAPAPSGQGPSGPDPSAPVPSAAPDPSAPARSAAPVGRGRARPAVASGGRGSAGPAPVSPTAVSPAPVFPAPVFPAPVFPASPDGGVGAPAAAQPVGV